MIERGGFSTEQEAYNAGVAAYAAWKSGNIGITAERVTLSDYLSVWLLNVIRPNLAPLTYDNYAATVRRRIVPHIGGNYGRAMSICGLMLSQNKGLHVARSQMPALCSPLR